MSNIVERNWNTKAGLPAVCLFVRDSHRCGYVRVPPEHPLHGKDYADDCECLKGILADDTPIGKRGLIPLFCWDGAKTSPEVVFDVHGGITHSGNAEDGYPITDPSGWWFGFDCAHAGDRSHGGVDGVLRSTEYVVAECERLAEQLEQCQEAKA